MQTPKFLVNNTIMERVGNAWQKVTLRGTGIKHVEDSRGTKYLIDQRGTMTRVNPKTSKRRRRIEARATKGS